MTEEEIMAGLNAGRVLCVDRRDYPELPLLMQMAREGKISSEFKQVDEQYSVMKFRRNEQ